MTMTQFKAKLQHPVALIAQGFVAGVLLFWATASVEGNAQAPEQTSISADAASH